MRQREHLNFRTPQHPSLGTNNWGGASPLLARNIPKESLDQRYLKLNSIRTRDEIFLADDQHFIIKQLPESFAPAYELPPLTPARRGVLFKLLFSEKEKNLVMLGSGSKKKKRWFPSWDPKNRWPQGWC